DAVPGAVEHESAHQDTEDDRARDGTDHPRQRGTIDLLGVLVHLDDLLDAALLRGAVGVQLLLLLRALLGLGLRGASHARWGPLGAGVSSRRAAGCGRRRS